MIRGERMARSQFTFYRSYYEALKELSKRDQSAVLMAVIGYALDGEEPEKLEGIAGAVFGLIKPTLDAANRRSDRMKERRGNSEDKSKTSRSEVEDKSNENDDKKDNLKVELESEVEVELEPEKDSLKKKSVEKKKPASRFTPPSLDDVQAYCRERGNNVNASKFVDFYTMKGWKVGNSPMRDWKAAVRTWEQRDEYGPHAPEGGKVKWF